MNAHGFWMEELMRSAARRKKTLRTGSCKAVGLVRHVFRRRG